jgi:hypothetical protein
MGSMARQVQFRGLLRAFERVRSDRVHWKLFGDSSAWEEENNVASVRAEGVAEALFELKRLDKLATFTEVATRAGFKPGAGGRTLMTCLTTVQRDWPHLQWWRAIPDDGLVAKESDHAKQLTTSGYELTAAEGKKDMVKVAMLQESLFCWETQAAVS